MKINPRSPRHWYLLLLQAINAFIAGLLWHIFDKADRPIVILYGHQFAGNLKALYEQWRISHQDKISLYLLTLDPEQYSDLQANGVKVLKCSNLFHMLVLARSKALISDHGLHTMTSLIRLTDIRFIDVWHGVPFKGFTPDDFKLQHRYHETWVTSDRVKQLYVNNFGFKEERVLPLGYARTDKLVKAPGNNSKFRQHFSIPKNKKFVLYAPTWQQDDAGRDLFPFNLGAVEFISHLESICEANNAMLGIRTHLNATLEASPGSQSIYCSQREFSDSEDILLGTDVLICDWSSIAFDFLALDRPTLFLDVPPPFANGFSLGKNYRFGHVASDFNALLEGLSEALSFPEAYSQKFLASHEEIKHKVYGENLDGKSANRQLDHLVTSLSN